MPSNVSSAQTANGGLFRTRIAGRPARTTEAFERLRATALHARPAHVAGTRLAWSSTDDVHLYGGSVSVSDDPAEGHWELISIRDDIFLVISDCEYTRARGECAPLQAA